MMMMILHKAITCRIPLPHSPPLEAHKDNAKSATYQRTIPSSDTSHRARKKGTFLIFFMTFHTYFTSPNQ